MRAEVLMLALVVGACNWLFRYGPLRAHLSRLPESGPIARFLAATGPAAIAALFVASLLPEIRGGASLPLVVGILSVIAVFALRRSVVLATLSGSTGYGLALWLGMAAGG